MGVLPSWDWSDGVSGPNMSAISSSPLATARSSTEFRSTRSSTMIFGWVLPNLAIAFGNQVCLDAAEVFMRRMIGDVVWERLPAATRDQRRAEFIETHFHRRPEDVHQYDLVLNSSLLGEELSADLIVRAARARSAHWGG